MMKATNNRQISGQIKKKETWLKGACGFFKWFRDGKRS